MRPSISAGRFAHDFPEGGGELAAVFVAGLGGDVGDGAVAVDQQLGGQLHALDAHVGEDGHAEHALGL